MSGNGRVMKKNFLKGEKYILVPKIFENRVRGLSGHFILY
jgi:hypothetical protein